MKQQLFSAPHLVSKSILDSYKLLVFGHGSLIKNTLYFYSRHPQVLFQYFGFVETNVSVNLMLPCMALHSVGDKLGGPQRREKSD